MTSSFKTEESVADLVGLLFMEIFENAPGGHHRIGTSDENGEPEYTRFAVREADGFILAEPEDMTPLELQAVITRTILNSSYAPVSLVSILPNGLTKVRGWLVDPEEARSLTAEELIEIYGINHETGRYRNTNPNTRYCQFWNE